MLIIPNNWAELQHYKDRSPPWIKLHKKLLDNFDFQRLPVASRALAPMLWLLASEHENGHIDATPEKLAFRLRCDETEISEALKPLIEKEFFSPCVQPASKALAKKRRGATPETEKSREEKSASADKLPTCQAQEIIDLYHEVLPELPRVRLQTKDRTRALAKAWIWVLTSTKDGVERRAETAEQALGWFREYFGRARENDFLMGRTTRTGEHANWRCDLDFLLTDKGMKHVIEKTEAHA